FDSIWSCEGQINTCVFPTSHPGYAQCSSVFPGWNTLQKWKKSFHSMILPAIIRIRIRMGFYTAKSHRLVCWQASISVNWAVGGVCRGFACLLGSSKLASFATELLI